MDGDSEILEKLDTLIRLQAHLAVAHLSVQKDKILFLDKAGLKPKAISEILGTTANTVNVALANARKAAAVPKKDKVKR